MFPRTVLTIYAPMIYTAPCVMFLMRADALRGEVWGWLALEISSFVGPVKLSELHEPIGEFNLGPKNFYLMLFAIRR